MTGVVVFAAGWWAGVLTLMTAEIVWSAHRARRVGPPREWVDEP